MIDYGEQMGFEIAGSSSDIGAKPLWKRPGFQNFVHAVKHGKANRLLIASRNSLSRSAMQIAQFQIMIENMDWKYIPQRREEFILIVTDREKCTGSRIAWKQEKVRMI